MLFEIVSTLSAGLFAGSYVHQSVEHPARVECGVELALRSLRQAIEEQQCCKEH